MKEFARMLAEFVRAAAESFRAAANLHRAAGSGRLGARRAAIGATAVRARSAPIVPSKDRWHAVTHDRGHRPGTGLIPNALGVVCGGTTTTTGSVRRAARGVSMLAGVLASWAGTAHAQVVIAQSTFDAGAEGWAVRSNNNGCVIGTLASPAIFSWQSDGGNPGGFMTRSETPGSCCSSYWASPAAFQGDLSAAYGGTLAFELLQSATNSQYSIFDVSLSGGGVTLYYDTAYNPRTTWTRYEVPLAAGFGWHVGRCDGPLATEAEMRAALSNVTLWLIRSEFRSGTDSGGLDNVEIRTASATTPPAVSTFDADRDGWWITGDATPAHDGAVGNPPGSFRSVDATAGIEYAFVAPRKFLGDRSDAIGKTLLLDIRVTPARDDFFPGANMVEFYNGLTRIGYQEPKPIAGNVWRRHAVPLVACPAWTVNRTPVAATPQEFAVMMGAIWQFIVRGEYADGGETGWIDNVRFGVCDPSAFAWAEAPRFCVGTTTTLRVAVGGDAPFTFQWRRNGTDLVDGDRLSGTRTAELVIRSVANSDVGSYDCVVTNTCGTSTSNTVTTSVCVGDVDDGSGTGTPDCGVTIDDLLYYLNIFASGAIAADVDDGSGTGTPDGGVTIDDLLYYLLRFEAGC